MYAKALKSNYTILAPKVNVQTSLSGFRMVLDHIGVKIFPQRKEKLLSDIGRLIK